MDTLIPNTSGFINRKSPREVGIPNTALIIGNQTAQYGPIQKNGYVYYVSTKNKYNWKQVLRHASYKRKNNNRADNAPRKPKGMHIVLDNDITMQVGTYYGRIRLRIEIDNEMEMRHLICLRCNYHNLKRWN